jgi:hypothetical protein
VTRGVVGAQQKKMLPDANTTAATTATIVTHAQVLPDRGKGVGVQLAAKGQVRHAAPHHSARFSIFLTGFQFNDLPPEVRPYKPDQGLKAELKASSAPGFDMAIGQVGVRGCLMFCFWNDGIFLLFWEPLVALFCYSFYAIVDAEQATDFQRLRHVTVNPNRCYSLT